MSARAWGGQPAPARSAGPLSAPRRGSQGLRLRCRESAGNSLVKTCCWDPVLRLMESLLPGLWARSVSRVGGEDDSELTARQAAPQSSHLGSIAEACYLAPRAWCGSESSTLNMQSRARLSGQRTRTLRADARPPRVGTRGPGDAKGLPSEHGQRCPLRHKHTLARSFLKHAVWLRFSFFSLSHI